MDGLRKLDGEELIRRMRAEFEKTMAEVAEAVNAAPDGHLIDASEERCRDVLGELRRRAYETAVQMRIEATEADVAFSPGEPLVQTRGRVRSATKRQSLDGLMQYLLIDYARFRALGLKIGSGPTESGCKSHARRLKGVGMRWTPAHAEAMLALESLYQSNLWPAYWKSRLKAAA